MAMKPVVADIYHGDVVGGSGSTLDGFKQAKDAGIVGIIHKSSQGTSYKDASYDHRRPAAIEAGLLWGAYHFNSGANVEAQVDWFFKCAAPDEKTVMALDYEDNPKSNLTPDQMIEFLRLVEEKLGRKAVIYSGNRLKTALRRLSGAHKAYVTSHRLWLAQYSSRVNLPQGFSNYWLWQYTGDNIGLQPHHVPGITCPGSGIDLNVYRGNVEQLIKEWA